jgi:hypothetical protein
MDEAQRSTATRVSPPVRATRTALRNGQKDGLFVSVDGELHRVESATQGVSHRGPVYRDVVGAKVLDPADAGRLAVELAAVLRANGLDDGSL